MRRPMDSRERTFLALNHEEPDRVPVDLWMSEGFRRNLKRRLACSEQDYLDAHDVDLRYIEGPAYVGPPPPTQPDGGDADIWGVRRRRVVVRMNGGIEHYREVAHSPLASAETVEEIEAHRWPSPDWFDYSDIERQCRAAHERGRVAVFQGDRLNRIAQLKPAMYLRGVEQILLDLAAAPHLAEAIFRHIRRFYLAYAERIFEAARGTLDLVLTGDDYGQQHGPLLSPGMWERFLGEGFAEQVALAHAYGVRVMHHTCGSVRALVPCLIERGLDVLQSLQPEAHDMNPAALKAAFGASLSFHGGLSVQRTLPFGTPEQVHAEVADRIRALAPGGGYILATAHNVQADVPLENVEALFAAHREYGFYR